MVPVACRDTYEAWPYDGRVGEHSASRDPQVDLLQVYLPQGQCLSLEHRDLRCSEIASGDGQRRAH